jgi:hypothetical protein
MGAHFAAESFNASDDASGWTAPERPSSCSTISAEPSHPRPLARIAAPDAAAPVLHVALGVGFADIRDTAIDVHRVLEQGSLPAVWSDTRWEGWWLPTF